MYIRFFVADAAETLVIYTDVCTFALVRDVVNYGSNKKNRNLYLR